MIKDKRIRNLLIWIVICGIVAIIGEVIVLNALEPVFQINIRGIDGFLVFTLGVGGILAAAFRDMGYYKERYEESLKKDDTQ